MLKKSKPKTLIMDVRPKARSRRLFTSAPGTLIKSKRLVLAIVAMLLLIAGGVLIVVSKDTAPTQEVLSHAKAQVGALMLLPNDEEPTLAAVDNKEKLTDPFLLQKAENGDQLLIYTKNQLVIIYRPGINKIVAVGNVFTDPALPEAKGTSLAVMNGSDDPEKTLKIINQVKAAYPDLVVTEAGKTNRQDFPNTIVIDNTNEKDNLIEALMRIISGKRGVVPLGESQGPSDFLIIVGKD